MISRIWFQSTPPAWGATFEVGCVERADGVSIHAPRVGGDRRSLYLLPLHLVSIHAPRVGGDMQQATRSPSQVVSIHAPRVGGDMMPKAAA